MDFKLNTDNILTNQNLLESYKGYLPLVICKFININNYLSNNSSEVRLQWYDKVITVEFVDDYDKFISEDLMVWLNENPKFNWVIQ